MVAAVGMSLAAQAQLAPKLVTLAWDAIPPAQITPDMTVRIYHETNLAIPKSLWILIAEVPASNNWASFNILPGVHFFTATTKSSFWQLESAFSNVAETPGLPSNVFQLTIRLGP